MKRPEERDRLNERIAAFADDLAAAGFDAFDVLSGLMASSINASVQISGAEATARMLLEWAGRIAPKPPMENSKPDRLSDEARAAHLRLQQIVGTLPGEGFSSAAIAQGIAVLGTSVALGLYGETKTLELIRTWAAEFGLDNQPAASKH